MYPTDLTADQRQAWETFIVEAMAKERRRLDDEYLERRPHEWPKVQARERARAEKRYGGDRAEP